MCESVAQSCPTLCDPVNFSPPGSSVHGVLQARILEWVAISFSRGSSWSRIQGWNPGLLHCRQILYHLSPQRRPSKGIHNVNRSWSFHCLNLDLPLPHLGKLFSLSGLVYCSVHLSYLTSKSSGDWRQSHVRWRGFSNLSIFTLL